MGEKKTENERDETKEKRFSPFGCPPIPPSIKLEADCFPGHNILLTRFQGEQKEIPIYSGWDP